MKGLKSSITALFIIICLSSCSKDPFWGLKGRGKTITEVRNVSGFSKVKLSFDADVVYTQDSVYYVEVAAQSNLMHELETDVEGECLSIRFSRPVLWHNKITVTVHSPQISGFIINGSGNIHASDISSSNSMELRISGSGDISISSLNAQYLDASISGSGNININSGKLDNEKLIISGSGDIDVLNVNARAATGKISGSGDIAMNINESLHAIIYGSGKIKYKGSPSINAEISGSGKLIQVY